LAGHLNAWRKQETNIKVWLEVHGKKQCGRLGTDGKLMLKWSAQWTPVLFICPQVMVSELHD